MCVNLKDQLFFDRGELKKPTVTPEGWLRAEGYITRSGIFEYVQHDGTKLVHYRPPDENAKAVPGFSMMPLTNDHPPTGLLNAENTQLYQVGTVGSPRADGEKIRAEILITNKQAIADLCDGAWELSAGYSAAVEFTPGTTPEGVQYDAVQRNIRPNHVALVREGRAGPQFRVQLDSADSQVVASPSANPIHSQSAQGIKMDKCMIDGVEYEIPAQAAQAFRKVEKASAAIVAQYSADKQAAEARADKAQALADSAKATAEKLKIELDAAPAKIRAEFTARAALESKASKVLTEAKFDGKSDLEIKTAVVEKVRGKALEGKSAAYVDAAFDLALEEYDSGEGALKDSREGTSEIADAKGAPDTAALIAEMKKRTANAHKTKA